jgi:hypothetical protein
LAWNKERCNLFSPLYIGCMKKWPGIFFLLFTHTAFSQQTIKGKVVAAVNGTPVAGSSVFINNTSKGTTADKNGYFELNDVPVGKHELVVSSIGYETNVFSFSAEQLPLQLRVELEVKVKELQNVTVEPSVEEGWDKWGKMFTDNFIGETPNALHCRIKNEKAIRFRFYKKTNRVVAYADEPIILENKALGYRISYQLEEFEVNFNTHTSFFSGYPFFEEIDKDRKGLRQRWKHSRDKSYYGSMMHFMHSLYSDSLGQDGFEVRRMVRVANKEKERIKKIYHPGRIINSQGSKGVSLAVTRQDSLQRSKDSLEYYERVMRQEDFKEIYGHDLLTADSLILKTEGLYKYLFFSDYLYITYKNEIEDSEYIIFSRESRSRTFQRSYLSLLNANPIIIDVNGNYYPPQEIFSSAYWGWSEKMADFLPIDYLPGKN